ncbi:putative carboxypeptidase [Planktothrix serta PCC 8927]|uniref:Carboxypeptidase n=1 Tax=Planktothrix serta PCC 8927 TaxID=671068 RepID=A0A7Z9DYL1_9CYAN|nr:M15 family metallopeptidase [Planktothrix serta]VXD13551.1 putative carboxypeptidase [Planktothrix serta PCC 8927]
MKNSSLPKQAETVADGSTEEIPEAIRDLPVVTVASSRPSQRPGLFWKMLGLAVVAFCTALVINYQFGILSPKSYIPIVETVVEPKSSATSSPTPTPSASATPTASASPTASPSLPDNLLGHLPYAEAPAAELESINADGSHRLRKAAAQAYQQMDQAALASGVSLVPISSFRTVKDQEMIFFEVKAQRGQVATKRAEVSAPPGYSEHHTGYAIDIGDGNMPSTNLSVSFEQTQAFQWLKNNAAFYSFELSFPKDNPQGVSYEPWHWRFVGDRQSLEMFYKARNQKKN